MRLLCFFPLKIHEIFEYAVLWIIAFLQMSRSRIKILIFWFDVYKLETPLSSLKFELHFLTQIKLYYKQ